MQGRVAGFGIQAINALYPAPPGASPDQAPLPGPRLYHPPTLPACQRLKGRLETAWVVEMQALLGIRADQLPMLWDCDFLLGPKTQAGEDTDVLCEINASSIVIGKLADFTVLDRDIRNMDPEHLRRARVVATVGGGTVHHVPGQ